MKRNSAPRLRERWQPPSALRLAIDAGKWPPVAGRRQELPPAAVDGEGMVAGRVVVASDNRLYRESLERVLRDTAQIVQAGSAHSAEQALKQVRTLTPDILLLDMTMSEALAVANQIAAGSMGTRIVALGVPEIEREVIMCAKAGVAGYVTRDASAKDVLAAIEAVARNEVHCPPRIAGVLIRRIGGLSSGHANSHRRDHLTMRETQVLRLMQQGLSNKLIARRLGIALPTVKNHVHHVLAKLGLHHRAEAMSLASRTNSPVSGDIDHDSPKPIAEPAGADTQCSMRAAANKT